MSKTYKKKLKLKIFPFLILIIFISVGFFLFNLYVDIPIKNIVIINNNYVSDIEIINLLKINNYPSFFNFNKNKAKKTLEKHELIDNVTINKQFFNVIEINVEEIKVLFKKNQTNEYVLSNNEELKLEQELYVPTLINYVPDQQYERLIIAMNKLDPEILFKMSEIEYVPGELDPDRFLVFMNDRNLVYLTLTKFTNINYYNEVLPKLNNKKGILYFDSGNHFEIIEMST